MSDGQLPRERAQIVLGEDLTDKTELAASDDLPTPIRRRDARRLRPAVLEREKRELGEARYLVARGVDAEDPTLIARSIAGKLSAGVQV